MLSEQLDSYHKKGIALPSARKSTTLMSILVLFVLLLAVNVKLFFVGFMSSDDSIYISDARELVSQPDYLPKSHWGFRYPLIWPIALLEKAVAHPSEHLYVIIPFAFTVLLGIVLIYYLWSQIGNRAAITGALLIATMPLLVVQSSIIDADTPETLFLLSSLLLFLTATSLTERPTAAALVGSGVCLGLAMLTRETAYGFLLVYGLLFLRGAFFKRSTYLWGFAGVVIIIAVEWLFYTFHGESPLYRYFAIARSHMAGGGPGNFTAGTGNISDSPLWGPILALLVNQEFALVFYGALLAYVWTRWDGVYQKSDLRMLGLFAFASLIYFVWLGYSGVIRSLPRYFTLIAVLAIFPIAIFAERTRFRFVALMLVAAILGGNYLALCVENIHPRFATRTVVDYATAVGEPIATDAHTFSRARQLAQLRRQPPKAIVVKNPKPEAPFLYAKVDGRDDYSPKLRKALREADEKGKIELIRTFEPPKLAAGWVLDLSGLGHFLSPQQYRWLAIRNPSVHVFRVYPGGAGSPPGADPPSRR